MKKKFIELHRIEHKTNDNFSASRLTVSCEDLSEGWDD